MCRGPAREDPGLPHPRCRRHTTTRMRRRWSPPDGPGNGGYLWAEPLWGMAAADRLRGCRALHLDSTKLQALNDRGSLTTKNRQPG